MSLKWPFLFSILDLGNQPIDHRHLQAQNPPKALPASFSPSVHLPSVHLNQKSSITISAILPGPLSGDASMATTINSRDVEDIVTKLSSDKAKTREVSTVPIHFTVFALSIV